VLICPDKFAGTITAVRAAAAVAAGWHEHAPDDPLTVRPLSDGGPGFVDVLAAALDGATRLSVPTTDPLGRPVAGSVLIAGDTGYVESAHACGLHLLKPEERDPRRATTAGLGALVAAATDPGSRSEAVSAEERDSGQGVRRIVVGLGGSATNDAGAGMLAALGAAPLDEAGYALPPGGAALLGCAGLGGLPRLREVELVGATDVNNPLLGIHGASSVYGPQKGATREDVLLLDAALARFAEVLSRDLPTCPDNLAELPGAGAAGGLGALILALGGRCESGIGLVRTLSGLDAALDTADLVITGEGSFDHQSLRGKVVAGVATAAQERGIPCVVVAGRVSAGRREAAAAGIAEAHSLVEHFGGDVDAAMTRPDQGLRELGARLARQWRGTH
jgi:glycerate kinase